MASLIISNAKLYFAGYDMSGDINALALKYMAELKESTTLIDTTRTRRPGLKDIGFQHEGFWNGGTGNIDDILFQNIGANNVPMTIAPLTGAEGELAYSFQAEEAAYSPGAKIGDMLAFSVSGADGAGPLVRGTLLVNGAKVASGNGTVFNVGAVSAAQKLYAALHVLAITSGGGPSLACKIQSAPTAGFAAPTDRLVFNAMTAAGAQWGAPIAGPITDAYWRVVFTLTNITSVTFLVNMGIL